MRFINSKKVYILSFIIPVIVMIAVFAILKIYPFGENTIMTGDTTYQLVDYLSYYKTIIFGNNDFSYSLSKNMGGEMAGFAAYYLFSPLNLLTLLFSKEYLFAGIGLIIILVPGLASLSMCYALRHLKTDNEGALIFALCYGLSAYIIVYNELLYYYTNIILLPIIFLLFRKMMDGEKQVNIGYVLLLAFAVINHYYTGYMICIFLTIYMIYYLVAIYEGRRKLRLFFRFVINSAISVGLSCMTLIPAVLSLSGEKDNLAVGFYLSFFPLDYFSKLYTGSFAGDFGAGMPNIYCGVIVTLFLIFIFINKEIRLKKRIWTALMLLFLWVDFCINTLNVVWHGFNHPIGFPYRQAFVVILFCIVTVYECTDFSMLSLNKKIIAVAAGLFIVYSVYVVIRKIDNTGIVSIVVTAGVFIILMAILYLPLRNKLMLLTVVTVCDLAFDAGYSLSHFYLTSVAEYQEPLAVVSDAVNHVQELAGDDIYRMEKMFRRTNNDAMMMDYAGLTHFSSSEKKATMDFMGGLGFRNNGNWAMYTGENTALADSILGIRYIASQFDGTGKPYELEYADNEEQYYIYHNKHAIPMMSAVSKDVFNVSMTENPFENQNLIADAISGKEKNVLYEQSAVRKDHADGSISFDVDIKNKGQLYCFFTAPDLQDVTLYLDGDEWTDYFKVYDWTTVNLEKRDAGEVVHVDLISNTDDPVIADKGYFAVIDHKNFESFSQEIKKDSTELYKISSSDYKGSYDSNRGVLLFSLPMDKGWHLYVDGKEYILREACGHLMAAEVPEGKHEIELKFVPVGKTAGLIISSMTLILLIIYSVFPYKNHNILRIKK